MINYVFSVLISFCLGVLIGLSMQDEKFFDDPKKEVKKQIDVLLAN
jgi:hypothetical protein